MKKLDYFIEKDPRIIKVRNYAKEKYQKANRPQHNWEHVLRDLYRALVIAETENDVNYSILIPSVILHDIGVTESDDYGEHAKKGAEIVKRDLSRFGYNDKEIEQVANCVLSHKDIPKPTTLEGKILFDADKLEKCGVGGVFAYYRAQLEFKKPIDEWIDRGLKNIYECGGGDYFTKKAKEMCGNGFVAKRKHFEEVAKELKERKDWTITEEDL